MKVVTVSVKRDTDKTYAGQAVIQSDGVNYGGTANRDDPSSAIHAALGAAIQKAATVLHDSVMLELVVKF
jgi:hypothetical protein